MLPGKQYTPADYVAMALRWKWVILIPGLIGAYAALVVSSRLPETFESDMLMQVVPQRIPSSLVQSTVTMRTVDRLSALTEQILSRTELQRLITDMNLYPTERERLPLQDVVDIMRQQAIKIEPVINRRTSDADSFYIRFSYTDRATARRVTERLGGLFIDVNRQDRNNLAQATQQFLVSQREEAKQKLEEAEMRMQRFREQNAGRLPTQAGYNMQAMQNAQMRAQALVESIVRDRDRKSMLERLYEEVEAEIVVPTPTLTSPAALQTGGAPATAGTTSQQLAVARQALAGFELRLTPEHPDLIRTKALVAKLETQLEAENKAAEEARLAAAAKKEGEPAAVVIDPREANRRDRARQMAAEIETITKDIVRKEEDEKRVRTSIEELQRRIEQVPGVESEWTSLTRDYETQSAKYRELLSKSESAELAANLEERQIGEQFRILDPARVPIRPTGVDRLRLNAAGTGLGFGVGLLLAALLELRDRTFRHAADIVQVLKLPVVALVPRIVTAADRRRQRVQQSLAVAVAVVLLLAGGFGFWAMKLWNFVV
jgi:polysaccharide chain length determinant protein (PEP-CTERM system associated)